LIPEQGNPIVRRVFSLGLGAMIVYEKLAHRKNFSGIRETP
jgi:hypothetical protein